MTPSVEVTLRCACGAEELLRPLHKWTFQGDLHIRARTDFFVDGAGALCPECFAKSGEELGAA